MTKSAFILLALTPHDEFRRGRDICQDYNARILGMFRLRGVGFYRRMAELEELGLVVQTDRIEIVGGFEVFFRSFKRTDAGSQAIGPLPKRL